MTRCLLPLALLAVAACSAPAEVEPDPGAEPGALPGDRLPAEGRGPAAARPDGLDEARQRWAAAGLDAYEMTLRRSCFCPVPDYTGPFQVVVRDGAVESVRLDGAEVDAERALTVDDLFALLDEAHRRGAVRVEAAFDAELGYPTSLYVDYDERIADEEVGYGVSALAPAER